MKFGFDSPSGFREKDLENGWQTTTTTEVRHLGHGYTIRSPYFEPDCSGEQINYKSNMVNQRGRLDTYNVLRGTYRFLECQTILLKI